LLILGQFRPLKNPSVFPEEFPKVDSVHGRPDRVPGLPSFPLGHPDQMQGQPAQKHVGTDPIFFAMMDGAKFERGLQRPEGALDLEELLVSESHVFRGERVVGGGQQIFSVEALLRADLPHVDGDPPVLRLPQVPTVGLVGEKRTGRLLVTTHLRVAHRFESRADLPEVLLPGGEILLRLLRIEDQDEPATALAVSHDDLLDLHVLPDLPVAAGGGERRLIGLLPVPQLLSEDVVAAGPLKDCPILFPGHPAVHHPHAPGHFPTGEILLDHLHRGGVGGIAGEHPAAHRDPFLGDRQPDHDLRKVVPLVLALPVAKKRPFLLVLFVPLEVGRGGVEEQEVHFEVQESGRGEEDFLLDRLVVLQKNIHCAIEMLQGNGGFVAQRHVLVDPLDHAALRVGSKRPVGYHGEDRPLHGRGELAIRNRAGEHSLDSDPLPQFPQKVRPTHRTGPDEAQGAVAARSRKGRRGFERILGGEEPAQALHQTLDGGEIQLLLPAEIVDDLGFGVSLLRIPDVVGELKIGDDRTIGVLAGYLPYIHTHTLSVYKSYVKYIYSYRLPTHFHGNQGSDNTTSRVYAELWS